MAASYSLVERCARRLICCSPRSAKNRSTWLIQDAEVGVKWVCQWGRLANQSRISLLLWLARPRGPATNLRMEPEDVEAAVKPAGLLSTRIIALPPHHYGAIFEKPA